LKFLSYLSVVDEVVKMGTNCGVDCSTSALFSWQNASGLIGMSDATLITYSTYDMIKEATRNSSADKIKMAGSYATSEKSSTTFVTSYTAENYKTLMSKLKVGDIAVYYNGIKGHAVVFTGFTSDGISYIDIGQGSLKNDGNSMWSESTMTYTWMRSKGYIPITNSYFKSFSTY